MKRLVGFVLFFASISSNAEEPAAKRGLYSAFVRKSEIHRETIGREGIAYVIGGSVGLASSLYLGIESDQSLAKVGYSLVQALSAGAIIHGALLLSVGDEVTQEAERLSDLSQLMEIQKGLSVDAKSRIMDEATRDAIQRSRQKRAQTKKIRGIGQLLSAGTAGTTLLLSEGGGTSSSLTLGFIALIATVGGVSDLLTADSEIRGPGFDFQASSSQGLSGSLVLSYRW